MVRKWIEVAGKKQLLTEGKAVRLEVRPGGWTLIIDPATGRRMRAVYHRAQNDFGVSLQGRLWHGKWGKETSRTDAPSGSLSGAADLSTVVQAQFPGKVRKILVNKGSVVQEGEPMLWIEAMKMEFAVRAPCPVRVLDVFVKEGQQLSPGDVFLSLEANERGQ